MLLRNLRQQVMEGARWIARAASNISIELFPLRSMFISHAGDEHRDYQMLERDYCAVGGTLEEIVGTPKNIGSEALSAFMFHRASQPDPLDLLGAMFVIEGLGRQKAGQWAEALQAQLGLTAEQVSFLSYHGQNDDNHFDRLRDVLGSGRRQRRSRPAHRQDGQGRGAPLCAATRRDGQLLNACTRLAAAFPCASRRSRALPLVGAHGRVAAPRPAALVPALPAAGRTPDLARIAVWAIVTVKRLLPFQFSWHSGLDWLSVAFLRRCVSREGGELLLRHFIVETALIRFVARNCGLPGVPEPALMPTTIQRAAGTRRHSA